MTRRVPTDLEASERALFEQAARTRCPRPEILQPALEGVLPEPLGDEVRAHVAACPVCRALVAALSAGQAADPSADDVGRVLARVTVPRPSRARIIRWTAVAAALLLAVGLSMARLVPEPDEAPPLAMRAGRDVTLPAPEYVLALDKPAVELPAEALVLRGGPAEPSVEALIAALEPYRRDDFAAAAASLRAVADAHPDNRHASFYLGVSLLLAGRPAEAVAPLGRARDLAPAGSWLRTEATWYLAVSAERSGERASALSALAELCGPSGPRAEAACEGLRQLTPLPQSSRLEESGAGVGARVDEPVVPLRPAVRARGRGTAGA